MKLREVRVKPYSSLLRRLWWLDRLNNFARVFIAGMLWANLIFAVINVAGIPLGKYFWPATIFVVVVFGYATVALWDNWRLRHELRAMQRETMERNQERGKNARDGWEA